MARVNPQLQARAGRNIGIEPGLYSAFLQDAGGPETDVNPTGDTVILECPQGMARSPLSLNASTNPPPAGWILNRTASDFFYLVIFRDDESNEIEVGNGDVAANAVSTFIYWENSDVGQKPWVLNPGEKILLRQTTPPPPPPP
jgi:hypothetical protein